MMTVVIDHHDSLRLSFHLKAPVDAGESAERFGNAGKGNLQFVSNGDGRKRVRCAMSSREVQAQISQRFSMMKYGKFDTGRRHPQILRRKIGLGGEPVG